jgi:hypothetical protein
MPAPKSIWKKKDIVIGLVERVALADADKGLIGPAVKNNVPVAFSLLPTSWKDNRYVS